MDLTYLELRDAGRRVNELEETVMYLQDRVDLEKRLLREHKHDKGPTERFQRALDEHFQILDKAYKNVEAYRGKRDSLQAATKYRSRFHSDGNRKTP